MSSTTYWEPQLQNPLPEAKILISHMAGVCFGETVWGAETYSDMWCEAGNLLGEQWRTVQNSELIILQF